MKRLTCILLTLCMAISICCVSASAALFTDVSDSFWASKEIAWAVDKGVVNGTSATTFSPNDKTLRGQMSLILYRYAGEPAVNGASSYSDVKPTVYYANAASWAQRNDILVSAVSGSNQFLGDTPISRAEFCAMIYNYAGYNDIDREVSSSAPFNDVNGLSSELTTAINWAYANGIVNGVDGSRFAPNDTLTRAQAVVMLYRYENKFASGSGPESNPGTETNPTPEIPAKPDGTTATYTGADVTAEYKSKAVGVLGSYFEVSVPVGQKVYFKVSDGSGKTLGVNIKDATGFYNLETSTGFIGVDLAFSGSVMAEGYKAGTMVAYLFENGKPDGTLSTVVIHVGGSTCSVAITTPSGASADPGSSSTGTGSTSSDTDNEVQVVIDLVNRVRQENGLRPLQTYQKLTDAAQVRASEIQQSFSHTRPNGEECFTVLAEVCAENIAAGYTSGEEVFDGWMNSDGHRANILSESATDIGVARNGSRWVQLFAYNWRHDISLPDDVKEALEKQGS